MNERRRRSGPASGWEPGAGSDLPCEIIEVPITTLNIAGRNIPISGGGYFRLYPYVMTRMGLNLINHQEQRPFVFYLHPWEFDPDQPRMTGAGMKSRFRHYLNLHKTEGRFTRLLQDFKFSTIDAVLNSRSPDDRVETTMSGHPAGDVHFN